MRTDALSPAHMVGAVPRSFVPPADDAHEYECPLGAANAQAVVLLAGAQTCPDAVRQKTCGSNTATVRMARIGYDRETVQASLDLYTFIEQFVPQLFELVSGETSNDSGSVSHVARCRHC